MLLVRLLTSLSRPATTATRPLGPLQRTTRRNLTLPNPLLNRRGTYSPYRVGMLTVLTVPALVGTIRSYIYRPSPEQREAEFLKGLAQMQQQNDEWMGDKAVEMNKAKQELVERKVREFGEGEREGIQRAADTMIAKEVTRRMDDEVLGRLKKDPSG